MNSKAMLSFWGLIILLVACSSLPPSPTAKPTEKQVTASASPTSTLDPSIATPIPPTPDPRINVIATPRPDQQVYIDPEGWYSVNFPAEMKPYDKPNSYYSGYDGSRFETGYMPEMGYVTRATFVCAWLANIQFKPEKSNTEGYSRDTTCSASTTSDFEENIHYIINENPGADPAHRFVYIKTTSKYPVKTVFSWLKPISETRYDTGALPLSMDDAAFWKNIATMPPGISVTEYELSTGNLEPSMHGLNPASVPTEARPTREPYLSYTPTPHRIPLEELGYTFKSIKRATPPRGEEICRLCREQLYRNGRLLFDYVTYTSDVYTFSTNTGPINSFLVDAGGASFLIENDAIHAWDHHDYFKFYDFFKPLLYQNELLWLKINHSGHASIQKSNRETIFSFALYDSSPMYHFGNPLEVKTFRTWNDHWILIFGSFLVQDGEFINKKLGYQEIFGWGLIHNKPAYFFSKGARFGISYDGQVLPIQYEEIANHLCCWDGGPAPFEARASMYSDSARFYGKRNGIWYYVVVKFK